MEKYHCVKSVRIRSFSGPYFPAFGLNMDRYRVSLQNSVRMRENTDQDNSEYGHFSRSEMLTGKSKTPMHSVIWFKIDVKLILITDISISTIWGSYATTFLSWGLILHHKKFVITYSKTANLCCSLVDELIQWHLQKL